MVTGTSLWRRRSLRGDPRGQSAGCRNARRCVPGANGPPAVGPRTLFLRRGDAGGLGARACRGCARGSSSAGAIRPPRRTPCTPVCGCAITNSQGVVRDAGFGASRWRRGLALALRHGDALELFDGFARENPLRVRLIDHGRGDAAGEAVQLPCVVEHVLEGVPAFRVAHPGACNELGRETYKPGVEEVLARTRLAGHGAISERGVLCYALGDVSHHYLGNLVGYILWYDLLALGTVGRLVQHLLVAAALVADDPGDRGRLDPSSTVGDGGVGGGHVERRHLVSPQYDGRLGMRGEVHG